MASPGVAVDEVWRVSGTTCESDTMFIGSSGVLVLGSSVSLFVVTLGTLGAKFDPSHTLWDVGEHGVCWIGTPTG